jgi:hypothetical protein
LCFPGRRFSGTDLVPNYSEDEILKVIQTSTSAVFMVNNRVAKRLGFDEEWKENTRLFDEWGKHLCKVALRRQNSMRVHLSPDLSLDLESDAELIDQRVASIRKQVEILEQWE